MNTHLAPRNPGFKFIDADDAETLADPEATDFAEQFDGVTNAACGESIHHSAKLLKHESYLVGAQARGVSRAVINACRNALRNNTRVDVEAFKQAMNRASAAVFKVDLEAKKLGAGWTCREYCSELVDRAYDILGRVEERDQAWAIQDVLEIYAAMQRAVESGQPYQTLLEPPPADSTEGAHGGLSEKRIGV